MSKALKRFGFARTNTDQAIETVHGVDSSSGSNSSIADEKTDAAVTTAADINEVEANQRLELFEKTRRWDPNLPNEDLNVVDDATHAHDAQAENDLVNRLVENSPYPEVCLPMN